MYKYLIILSLITISFTNNNAFADDHSNQGPGAVEMLACSYNEGKTVSDLNSVVKSWNKWADKKGQTYSAWTLSPFAVNNEFPEIDYIWFGLAPDFEEWGSSLEQWVQEGENSHGVKFAEVSSCSPRSLYAIIPVRQTNWDQKEIKNNPFQLSNCKFKEGKTMSDLMKAASEFNKYIDEVDADPLIAIFIPDAGNELNPIWDIKVGAGWSNFIEMGKARNSGYQTGNSSLQKTWGSVVDCDSPRVYTTNQVRMGVNQ